MSRGQSLTNRVRDPEERRRLLQSIQAYERRNRRTLIIGSATGLLLGLLLGLFIGWFVWPVHWTNAWPSDMADEARADYIAAVTDAYAAAPSQEAAQLAADRLRWFEPDVGLELAAAQRYLTDNGPNQGDPNVVNIDQLIEALQLLPGADRPQLPSDEETAREPDAVVPDVTAPDAVAADDTAEDQVMPADSSRLPDWLLFALWLLTAFILIAGGIWVLRTVMRTPADRSAKWNDDEIDEFEDHDFVQPAGADPFGDHADSSSASVIQVEGDRTEDVDSDHDQEPMAPASAVADGGDAQAGEGDGQNISVMSGSAGAVINLAPQDDPDGYAFEPESEPEYPLGSVSTTIIPDVSAEDVPSVEELAEDESAQADAAANDQAEGDRVEGDRVDDSELDPLLAIPADGGVEEIEPAIAVFTAHFQPGLDGYEEAFRIEDEGLYFGDCGMGVNIKHGLVGQNPEHVAVLDVWIVDQAENADISFEALSLVSKYGVAAKLEQQLADGENPQQTLPAPRSRETFQIAGTNLLADCEIVSVSYVELGQVEGVFSECKVNITVRRRP